MGRLEEEAAVRRKQFGGGAEVGARMVERLNDVKHGESGEAAGAKRGALGIGDQGGNLWPAPGDARRFARIIEADDAEASLAHHAEEETAAASDIEQRAARRGPLARLPHELHSPPRSPAPPPSFQPPASA